MSVLVEHRRAILVTLALIGFGMAALGLYRTSAWLGTGTLVAEAETTVDGETPTLFVEAPESGVRYLVESRLTAGPAVDTRFGPLAASASPRLGLLSPTGQVVTYELRVVGEGYSIERRDVFDLVNRWWWTPGESGRHTVVLEEPGLKPEKLVLDSWELKVARDVAEQPERSLLVPLGFALAMLGLVGWVVAGSRVPTEGTLS